MTDHGHRRLGRHRLDDLRALRQDHRRVTGQQSDQLFAPAAGEIGARQAAFADKIGLGFGDDPIHAQVVWRH